MPVRSTLVYQNTYSRFSGTKFAAYHDRSHQSSGIDPNIWVGMWPKLFGQFGHLARDVFGLGTKMTVPVQGDVESEIFQIAEIEVYTRVWKQ